MELHEFDEASCGGLGGGAIFEVRDEEEFDDAMVEALAFRADDGVELPAGIFFFQVGEVEAKEAGEGEAGGSPEAMV